MERSCAGVRSNQSKRKTVEAHLGVILEPLDRLLVQPGRRILCKELCADYQRLTLGSS
jgi:hypothetical protein